MIVHKVVNADELEKLTSQSHEPWELVSELAPNVPMPSAFRDYPIIMGGPRFLVRRGETPGFAALEKKLAEKETENKHLKEDMENHRKALEDERERNRLLRREKDDLVRVMEKEKKSRKG